MRLEQPAKVSVNAGSLFQPFDASNVTADQREWRVTENNAARAVFTTPPVAQARANAGPDPDDSDRDSAARST
jgi:hypothetical protein